MDDAAAVGEDGGVWRLRRGELVALDWVVAAGLTLMFLSLSGGAPPAVRLAVAAAMGLPVGARRRWPVPVLCVVTVASLAAAVGGVVDEPFLSSSFALYWVAVTAPASERLPGRAIGIGSVVLLVVTFVAGAPEQGPDDFAVYVLGLPLNGMAWTVGRAVRERREYAARSARQYAERAVEEERLRIARELHDVVAHHIGVIAVKAGVANHVLPVRPEAAGEALRDIETASRGALAEMRQLLGVLRSGSGSGSGSGSRGEPAATRHPAPGLADLPELVARAEAAGVTVELRASGVAELSEGVGRSAYRVVQEAVTNVMKHAAPTRCRVVLGLEADGEALRIEVTDDGPGGRGGHPAAGGHGLIGMRERVGLYGGELRAGPRPEGGFAVTARLPLGEVVS